MAPTTRSSCESSPTKEGFGVKRITRAKSLPGSLAQSLVVKSSKPLTRLDIRPIEPKKLVLCKSCKTPIVKTPPAKVSQKTQTPVQTSLGEHLQAYISEALNRNTAIQAAYASASRDFGTLGNPDVSGEHSPINTRSQWHAPYTKEACARVGNLMGELGRALHTSLQGIAALEQALGEEKLRSQSEGPEQRLLRAEWEREWWSKAKKDRIEGLEAVKQRKRRRARR